jgi:hypothetical protein
MKGGYSSVVWATDLAFTTPHTIACTMKETKLEPASDTEDDSAGNATDSGKKFKLTIESEDMTAANWTDLLAAEAARTALFYKLIGLNTAQNAILKSAIPIITTKPAEVGKNWRKVLTASGSKATEADMLAITV